MFKNKRKTNLNIKLESYQIQVLQQKKLIKDLSNKVLELQKDNKTLKGTIQEIKKQKEMSQEETLTEDNFQLSKITNKSNKSLDEGNRIQTILNFCYHQQKLDIQQFNLCKSFLMNSQESLIQNINKISCENEYKKEKLQIIKNCFLVKGDNKEENNECISCMYQPLLDVEKIKFFLQRNSEVIEVKIKKDQKEFIQELTNNHHLALQNDLFFVAFDSQINTQFEKKKVVQEFNKKLQLFYFCLKYYELQVIIDDNNEGHITARLLPYYIIIETYFPLINFFQFILSKVFQQIKLKTVEKICGKNFEDFVQDNQQQDNQIFFEVKEETFKCFNDINFRCLKYIQENLIKINLFKENYKFQIYNEIYKPYTSIQSFYQEVLDLMSFEDFYCILIFMLLEQKIVFVSENQNILSKLIQLFTTIIYPFKWQYPCIFNLTEDCDLLMCSPVPIIIGVYSSQQNFYQRFNNIMKEDKIQPIKVFVDDCKIIVNEKIIENIEFPTFSGNFEKFRAQYKQKFSAQTSDSFKVISKNQSVTVNYISQKKKSFFASKKTIEKKNVQQNEENIYFFLFLYEILKKFIISKIPLHKTKQMSIKDVQILSENESDEKFLRSFFRTQMFTDYFENFKQYFQLIHKLFKP